MVGISVRVEGREIQSFGPWADLVSAVGGDIVTYGKEFDCEIGHGADDFASGGVLVSVLSALALLEDRWLTL